MCVNWSRMGAEVPVTHQEACVQLPDASSQRRWYHKLLLYRHSSLFQYHEKIEDMNRERSCWLSPWPTLAKGPSLSVTCSAHMEGAPRALRSYSKQTADSNDRSVVDVDNLLVNSWQYEGQRISINFFSRELFPEALTWMQGGSAWNSITVMALTTYPLEVLV